MNGEFTIERDFVIEKIGRITLLEMAAMVRRVPIVRPPICCYECTDPILAGRVVRGRLLCDPCAAFTRGDLRRHRIYAGARNATRALG